MCTIQGGWESRYGEKVDGKKKENGLPGPQGERANGPHMSRELLGCGEILGVANW